MNYKIISYDSDYSVMELQNDVHFVLEIEYLYLNFNAVLYT